MTVDLTTLPSPETLPIPDDVRPNARWSPLMIEFADHIGPRATLELCVRFGGQRLRVPRDPKLSPFRAALGDHIAAEISRVFAREQIDIPVGRSAILYARRQGVLAQVRSGHLNLSEAARALRCGRRLLSKLINQSDEGTDGVAGLPCRRAFNDPRQIDMFDG